MLGLSYDEEVGVDIATVEQVRAVQEITLGSVVLDHRTHHAIGRGGGRGQDLGNQIRPTIIARFCEVALIFHSMRIAFRTVARLQVIGRLHKHGVVYLSSADHDHRLPWPTFTGAKSRDEGALPASQRPSPPCGRPCRRLCGRTSPAPAPSSGGCPPPLFAHTPAGCGHGGTRHRSTSRSVHT